jgi:hypothetical protein
MFINLYSCHNLFFDVSHNFFDFSKILVFLFEHLSWDPYTLKYISSPSKFNESISDNIIFNIIESRYVLYSIFIKYDILYSLCEQIIYNDSFIHKLKLHLSNSNEKMILYLNKSIKSIFCDLYFKLNSDIFLDHLNDSHFPINIFFSINNSYDCLLYSNVWCSFVSFDIYENFIKNKNIDTHLFIKNLFNTSIDPLIFLNKFLNRNIDFNIFFNFLNNKYSFLYNSFFSSSFNLINVSNILDLNLDLNLISLSPFDDNFNLSSLSYIYKNLNKNIFIKFNHIN